MSLINRPQYLEKLETFTDKPFIKVLTGVRRSGKSSILSLYAERLSKGSGPDSVLLINFDTPEYISVDSMDKFAALLKENITPSTHYILLDEVQLVPAWERVVNAYYATGKYDITITGSNMQMLSSELATLLTGRYVEIEILPLSYKEFLLFKNSGHTAELFEEYIRFGGFPALSQLSGESEKFDSLRAILDSILYNDILKRSPGIRPQIMDRTVAFLNDSIGFPVSLNKLTHTLKSAGFKVYYEAVANYMKALESSYLFLKTELVRMKGQERFGLLDKYYSVDIGFVNLTQNPASENRGSLLENAVYLELRRRGYEISAGRDERLEVDFIAKKNGNLSYYQVSETILDPTTRNREFSALQSIGDSFPKYVLSMDSADYSHGGITHLRIPDFLLSS